MNKDYEYIALIEISRAHLLDLAKPAMPDETLAALQNARQRVADFAFTNDPSVSVELQREASRTALACLTQAQFKYTAALKKAISATLEGKATLPEMTLLTQAFPDHTPFAMYLSNEKKHRAELASVAAGTHPKIIELKDKISELEKWDLRKIGLTTTAPVKPRAVPAAGDALLAAYAATAEWERPAFADIHWKALLSAELESMQRAEEAQKTVNEKSKETA